MTTPIEFFTATCLNWQPLLDHRDRKQVVIDSLKFLVDNRRIWVYGFVIMPNHIHLMWRKREEWINKCVEQMFLKFTAQQIKFQLIDNGRTGELEQYRSSQKDRNYHFWERRPHAARIYRRSVAAQKIGYIHYNPVKAGLCKHPLEYEFSSARYYASNDDEWGFLTRYEYHLK